MVKKSKVPLKVFNVHINGVFKDKVISQILSRNPENLLRRTIETTLADILEDFTNIYFQYIKIKFQIIKVEGESAYAKFKGHELTRDYVRSLVRIGTSRVDVFYDLTTNDNIQCRIQTLAITSKRVSYSIQSKIRKKIIELYDEKFSSITLDDLVNYMILGKMAAEAFSAAKKIYPIKKIEIIKSKILTQYLT